MGFYRHFPYTNFHELNLDWLIGEMKRITQEWINYNTTWNDWKEDTDKKFAELKEYVINYFDNLDIESEIIRQFNILEESGYFEAVIEEIALKKENINCDLVGSGFIPYNERPGAMNGGCFIGNNKVAVYFSYDTSDVGILEIRDAASWEKLTEKELMLYHGNSLTFVPDEKLIYACGCIGQVDTSRLIPTIVVIDVSDPMNPTIVEEKTPPLPSYSQGIYSLAYDPITEVNYAICSRGTTPGEFNRLVKYNKDLTEIVGEQILYDSPKVSSQGVQVVFNDRAYLLVYTPSFRSVYSFDVNTGETLNVYSLPTYVNGYRFIGEVQCIIHNTDTEDWFVGARYTGSGVSGYIGWSMIQCGFYKSMPHIEISKNTVNEATGIRPTITVEQGGDFIPENITRFPCIMDAINASRTAGVEPLILFSGSNQKIGSCEIFGFNGIIAGSANNLVEVPGQVTITNSNIRFTYVDFQSTTNTHSVISGNGCLSVYHSTIILAGCTSNAPLLISETIYLAMQTANQTVRAGRSLITGNTATLPSSGNWLSATVYLPYTTLS